LALKSQKNKGVDGLDQPKKNKYEKLDEELTIQNQIYIDKEMQEQEVRNF
jgi:hypothetical protein